mmetsp:Transcript_13483/g.18452  ORF Transcript_13483/g.18452 Transcript_13483/m.18452 type:complete len:322 (+) Transcript_13483:300-1265(+)|eukprot:CAMPEP_0201488448 /NCGR_PEP_ID=MMETSP0151_2-20130828/18245_1 /ASSEMBLY_ACC=CAM_ASM_000257 /TAXON_ID=200890 /ORGANISM="Paramoeba atlantica, Strain 621/1 / CCAP 1560/9" /LENGTH=321 /DNA_ID=CAMNT_0047873735 /DNA_START=67 /DNA_END=1032 /DNA_ORIENTATION=+
MDPEEFSPSLVNILEQKELKWIFVGGKGGVGKTTTASCLAILLASCRENVLLISTDPAHNVSDAFDQKFSKDPTLVNGFTNLFAMEIDPAVNLEENLPSSLQSSALFKDILGSIPGIDEAMSFAEVLKLLKSMKFDVVVFDTAPTGHTLRLLSFPALIEKGMGKIMGMQGKFGGLFTQVQSMMGGPQMEEGEVSAKLEQTKAVVEEVTKQFKNPDLTTFVCVMIPEFLSLYETERLIQELTKQEIDTHNVVINQVVYPDTKVDKPCSLCTARQAMQSKYITQATMLYEDFHLVKMPLLPKEVRGVPDLKEFGKHLTTPYSP